MLGTSQLLSSLILATTPLTVGLTELESPAQDHARRAGQNQICTQAGPQVHTMTQVFLAFRKVTFRHFAVTKDLH